jgi:Tfp pilus assembly protein PilX
MTNRSEHRTSERGSAYIIALMALVVLSILGLGLALITQTEMQIGAAEVTQQRVLYAADSGVSRATARALSKFDCSPVPGNEFVMVDPDITAVATFANVRQEVGLSGALTILDNPCPLCMVNNAGGSYQAGEQTYYQVHHTLTARAQRLKGADPQPMAQREVGAFFSLEPWPQIGDCYSVVEVPGAPQIRM